MAKLNWLDRARSFFSAEAELRITRARAMSEMVRKYEAASRTRRTQGWNAHATSANSEIIGALSLLRARSSDLVRNNPYAAKAITAIADNVVGTGIIPQAKGRTKSLTAQAEALAVDHLDTTAIDADGLHNLYGLEGLAMRTIAERGSVLIRRRRRRPTDGLPLPFQIQVLDSDFLDHSKNAALKDGGYIVGGVEFDPIGRRRAYWLFDQHPGDSWSSLAMARMTSRAVPASEVLHIYRVDRPGQVDGVPWGTPCLIRLRDFDEYQDAQLLRQKIAAMFSAFVYDGEFGLQAPVPNGEADDNALVDKMEPGMIELLPNGKRVEFANPPQVTGFVDVSNVSLHAIAAGYGVTYEELTGDLRGVNFSSGRMGWLAFHRSVNVWRQQMLIPRMLVGIWQWFNEAAMASLKLNEPVRAVWTPPKREMIDPTKEVPAARDEIRAGLKTLSAAIRERGEDPATYLAEMKQDADLLDELGLVLDSDPRRTSSRGQQQQGNADGQTD